MQHTSNFNRIFAGLATCLLPACAIAPGTPAGGGPGFAQGREAVPYGLHDAGHWEDAGDPSQYQRVGSNPGALTSAEAYHLHSLVYYPIRLCTASAGRWA